MLDAVAGDADADVAEVTTLGAAAGVAAGMAGAELTAGLAEVGLAAAGFEAFVLEAAVGATPLLTLPAL